MSNNDATVAIIAAVCLTIATCVTLAVAENMNRDRLAAELVKTGMDPSALTTCKGVKP